MPYRKNINKSKKFQIAQAKSGSIHYSYLIVFMLAFVLGITSILIAKNYLQSEIINLSTLDLLNFVFSIVLSASAIVLSITAIILSKNSEQSISRQNNESKNLQNEIFSHTIEVLSKIQSSSGITEKRIDDISKRIDDIPRRTGGGREKEIKEIIRRTFLPANSQLDKLKEKRKEEEDDEKEAAFKNEIMLGIANTERVIVEKIGEGDFDGSGKELVDGLFSIDTKKFSVSTFCINENDSAFDIFDQDIYRDYFLNLLKEISSGTFFKSFLVFNKKVKEDPRFVELYKKTTSLLKDEIKDKLIIVSGRPEEIIKEIIESLS